MFSIVVKMTDCEIYKSAKDTFQTQFFYEGSKRTNSHLFCSK
jgi:hypothetical protein